MRIAEIRAHQLAYEIERLCAKRLEQASGTRGRSRIPWHEWYDQHAATELGNLIYSRMARPSEKAGEST